LDVTALTIGENEVWVCVQAYILTATMRSSISNSITSTISQGKWS